jgi:hypothetical protein
VEAGPADINNPLTDSYQWSMACETCPPPTAQITSTNISCFGGSDGSYTISNGSGGSGTGYQVAISTDGFVTYYNLPKTFSGLLANTTYTFRVKDSTGATNNLTPAQLTQPTQQTASTTIITQPVCNSSGVIQITSSGGVFPKTYQIYEDNTFPYNDCTNGTLKQTFTNVTSGTPTRNVSGLTSSYSYCAKVTDANGCITITNQVFLNECDGGSGNGGIGNGETSECGRYGLFNEGNQGTIATFTYNEYPSNSFITVNIPFGSEGLYVQAYIGTVNLISGSGTAYGPTECL